MNRIVFLCLVLTVLSNISARWVKNVTKDENKNLKSAIAHWKENVINKIYTTTTSTSTFPPTTSTIPTTTTNNKVMEAIEELKDEIKEITEITEELKNENEQRIEDLRTICNLFELIGNHIVEKECMYRLSKLTTKKCQKRNICA